MQFQIATGEMEEIEVGSLVKVATGYLPPACDNQWLEVVAVDESGPYCNLEVGQESCISPQIITRVA